MADVRHGTYLGYVNDKCRCLKCARAWTAYRTDWALRNPLAPDDQRHGKLGTYTNRKCRCEACSQTYREWQQEYRRKKAADDA